MDIKFEILYKNIKSISDELSEVKNKMNEVQRRYEKCYEVIRNSFPNLLVDIDSECQDRLFLTSSYKTTSNDWNHAIKSLKGLNITAKIHAENILMFPVEHVESVNKFEIFTQNCETFSNEEFYAAKLRTKLMKNVRVNCYFSQLPTPSVKKFFDQFGSSLEVLEVTTNDFKLSLGNILNRPFPNLKSAKLSNFHIDKNEVKLLQYVPNAKRLALSVVNENQVLHSLFEALNNLNLEHVDLFLQRRHSQPCDYSYFLHQDPVYLFDTVGKNLNCDNRIFNSAFFAQRHSFSKGLQFAESKFMLEDEDDLKFITSAMKQAQVPDKIELGTCKTMLGGGLHVKEP